MCSVHYSLHLNLQVKFESRLKWWLRTRIRFYVEAWNGNSFAFLCACKNYITFNSPFVGNETTTTATATAAQRPICKNRSAAKIAGSGNGYLVISCEAVRCGGVPTLCSTVQVYNVSISSIRTSAAQLPQRGGASERLTDSNGK